MSEQRKDNLLGRSLGQFEIQQEIGRGGMATVYKGVQRSMNRIVAIKVLPPHLLHDPTFYERFEREVDVIAHLEHPHILPIYDYGQSEGVPYIAMRFLGGGSLEERVKRGLPELEDLERPIRQVAQALDYAHQQGVIHRDLKPANIMLDETGNAYLSDFGIARVLGSDMTGSMIIGTPAYMSPEQANGMPIDGRSDIYSLGIVLFELITGKEPYQAETPMAVLLKHINEPIPPVSDFREGIPEAVEYVIDKATAKNPDHRFSSAGELAEAFSKALRGETAIFDTPTQATKRASQTQAPNATRTPAKGIPVAETSVTPTGGFTDSGMMQPQRGLSTPTLVAIVLVVLIVVGGSVAAAVLLSEPDPNGPPDLPPLQSLIPTPFPRASTITQDSYSITMPDDWIPPSLVINESEGTQTRHLWRSNNGDAFVRLTLYEAQLTDDRALFEDEVQRYASITYDPVTAYSFVDEATAENGSIRRSYYVIIPQEGESPVEGIAQSGQVDVFFSQRGTNMVIIEMYIAEARGNELITQMQLILDSLRVNLS